MTSYSDLVSCEAGKAENLSTHFKLSRLEDCKAWQAFGKTTGKRSRTKLLRIYIAGSMPTGNTHSGHFNIAIAETKLLNHDWKSETLTVREVRKKEDWSHPSFLVDWLLESDFHVILCQGIHNGMLGLWKPQECQKEVLRLYHHNGFPTGNYLLDPVISADKFEYLCAAHKYCIPSFKLPLAKDDGKLIKIMEALQQFMIKYSCYDGDKQEGFIIKAPYVQNQVGFGLKFFKSYEEFLDKLRNIYESNNTSLGKLHVCSTDVFPYLIIQPRMQSNNESKIILWNGVPQFVCSSLKGLSKRKSTVEMMSFAEEACKHLKIQSNNVFLCDGITRVDLFCTAEGTLVVNEFESLDANYGCSEAKGCQLATKILHYYCKILSKLI